MLIAIMQMMEEFCTDRESKRLRLLARGKPIVTLPYMVYTDDTSGNKTKKWNKFDVCCVILAGLPRKAKCPASKYPLCVLFQQNEYSGYVKGNIGGDE